MQLGDLSVEELQRQFNQDQVLLKLRIKEREIKIAERNKHKNELDSEIKRLEKETEESDNEHAYPTLAKLPGSPFAQTPKKVLAVAFDADGRVASNGGMDEYVFPEIYYLCSWVQDYQGTFYTPSLVPSLILQALE